MKKFIFMMSIAILTLGMNACKTQNKASDNTEASIPGKADVELVEKYWKLIELYGNPVIAGNNSKEPHIIIKMEGDRFNGNAGCNTITGSYQTKEPGGRITFSQTIATQMMCLNMDTETQFLEVLRIADSYIAKNDTLTLHRARMAPLARFVAVYM